MKNILFLVFLVVFSGCSASFESIEVESLLVSGKISQGDSVEKLPLVVPRAVFSYELHKMYVYGSERNGFIVVCAFKDLIHTSYKLSYVSGGEHLYYFYSPDKMSELSKLRMAKI